MPDLHRLKPKLVKKLGRYLVTPVLPNLEVLQTFCACVLLSQADAAKFLLIDETNSLLMTRELQIPSPRISMLHYCNPVLVNHAV